MTIEKNQYISKKIYFYEELLDVFCLFVTSEHKLKLSTRTNKAP